MKFSWCFIAILSLFLVSEDGIAQRHRLPMEGERPTPERLERFKKMKLVEILDLTEEDAVRFFAKQNAHEDKMKELMRVRKEAVDDIEYMIRHKAEEKDLQKNIQKILEIDQNMFAERRRYQDELRSSLKLEQFAKYLVFERNFERELRGAMEELHRKQRFRERD